MRQRMLMVWFLVMVACAAPSHCRVLQQTPKVHSEQQHHVYKYNNTLSKQQLATIPLNTRKTALDDFINT
jgi:hypothetical protein